MNDNYIVGTAGNGKPCILHVTDNMPAQCVGLLVAYGDHPKRGWAWIKMLPFSLMADSVEGRAELQLGTFLLKQLKADP